MAHIRKSTAEWSAFTEILSNGTKAIEECTDGTVKIKIGDGAKTFSQLSYIADSGGSGGSSIDLSSKADLVNGEVPLSQLPSSVKNIINGYLYNGLFYKNKNNSTYSEVITSETGKIYIDIDTNNIYRWNGSSYVSISSSQDVSGKEDTSNKVTSLSSSSTNTQYPSAKCVYDIVGNVESALAALR